MNMTMSKYHRHSLSKQIIKHLLLTSQYSDKGEKHSSKHSCFCLLLIQLIRKQVSRKPKSDLLPKLIIATLTQHLSYIFFFEKKCLITMIDRTHSTILNFKFQLWFLSTGFYIIKCPERTLSVMSSYKMSIQSIKKYLFMCFYNLPEEAHIKWQVTKQQKTYIFLFPPIFPKCAPFLTVSVNLSSNCFCIISKW